MAAVVSPTAALARRLAIALPCLYSAAQAPGLNIRFPRVGQVLFDWVGDGEEVIRNKIQWAGLFKQLGYEVEERRQAVVTDMMMPIVDGPTLIRALQKVDPQVKVIGISGLGSEAVLSKAGKLSVRTFLKKPYSSASLLGSLREVINEEV